mmetsp:Transcript_17996/g.57556  ORF Transcript_17996/g.57556 Transcript_17996/m.57556 type:complete len:264 (-) Transcript_17996:131-922(-)
MGMRGQRTPQPARHRRPPRLFAPVPHPLPRRHPCTSAGGSLDLLHLRAHRGPLHQVSLPSFLLQSTARRTGLLHAPAALYRHRHTRQRAPLPARVHGLPPTQRPVLEVDGSAVRPHCCAAVAPHRWLVRLLSRAAAARLLRCPRRRPPRRRHRRPLHTLECAAVHWGLLPAGLSLVRATRAPGVAAGAGGAGGGRRRWWRGCWKRNCERPPAPCPARLLLRRPSRRPARGRLPRSPLSHQRQRVALLPQLASPCRLRRRHPRP